MLVKERVLVKKLRFLKTLICGSTTVLICSLLFLGVEEHTIFASSTSRCISRYGDNYCLLFYPLQKKDSKEETNPISPTSTWDTLKKGGVVGAAALTGGVLMALTSVAGAGLAAGKMVKRVREVDEFEFKAEGPNHNQGRLAVGIFISGLAFEDEDFTKPWEGRKDYIERLSLI